MITRESCGHEHGDWLAPWWLCGQCFTKFSDIPKRYEIRKVPADGRYIGEGGAPATRQEIVWQARKSASYDGATLVEFLGWIIERFKARGGVDTDTATELAIECLQNLGCAFGDGSVMWTRDAAYDLADGELDYWEHDTSDFCNG